MTVQRDETVEAVARVLAVDEYADRHCINIEHEKIEGTDHFERWYEQSAPTFRRVAVKCIGAIVKVAMT